MSSFGAIGLQPGTVEKKLHAWQDHLGSDADYDARREVVEGHPEHQGPG
jgi:hypothetical protein